MRVPAEVGPASRLEMSLDISASSQAWCCAHILRCVALITCGHSLTIMEIASFKLGLCFRLQGITFEKARQATNRSLKMTIWSLGSDLCYDEKISARGRHYNTIRQGAPFHHCLSGHVI